MLTETRALLESFKNKNKKKACQHSLKTHWIGRSINGCESGQYTKATFTNIQIYLSIFDRKRSNILGSVVIHSLITILYLNH